METIMEEALSDPFGLLFSPLGSGSQQLSPPVPSSLQMPGLCSPAWHAAIWEEGTLTWWGTEERTMRETGQGLGLTNRATVTNLSPCTRHCCWVFRCW